MRAILACFPFIAVLFLVACSDGAGDIEGVAYNENQRPPYVPEMFVLFKNGEMCSDLGIITTDMSIAEHKKQYPGHWGKWKWSDERLMHSTSDGWVPFDYNLISPPFPTDTALNNAFSHISGSGGAALSNSYTFSSNGRFVYGHSFSAFSTGAFLGDSSVTGIGADVQGTYSIDGFRLTLNFDDGRVQRRSIIAQNPDNLKYIYLDRMIYLRKG